MCLAVPAKIIALEGESAVVELNGVQQQANVALITDPSLGDYVLLHAGFAIQKWADKDVAEWRNVIKDIDSYV
ncbi:MAG: HypC/HybG/HupF family hydrogenase formation chaperone [Candidatus Electrothrix sp. AX5]|uniref:Hydrogenase expression/formation protein HypC n=1 Tax=Candidatus Electrothrix aarhusensis TaxID=1859131 RepID=A0A3S4T698_9BACT|nr:HypC/HybG/HupF family hydrogenase formation chaperone [Candidatus Electrothrix sp. AX5]RWX43947.1 hydrogenase expression/formation protein HypC [Candidatus Electrothrix aarhusensis]